MTGFFCNKFVLGLAWLHHYFHLRGCRVVVHERCSYTRRCSGRIGDS